MAFSAFGAPDDGTSIATGCAARAHLVRGPKTRTILQKHGPNHLGLRYNELPEHQMALITSGCVPSRCTC